MKTMIVYHANCIDGITAAGVTTKYLTEVKKERAEDIISKAMNYDDDMIELHSDLIINQIEKLYVVDFSFKLEELKTLCAFCKVRLLDHHASAFRNLLGGDYEVLVDSREEFSLLEGKLKILLDNNECGASLCYKHFFPDEPIPELIRLVKDYDLWRFELGYTKAINKFLRQVSKDIEVYLSMLRTFEDGNILNGAYQEGKTILSYECKLEDDLIESGVTPITIDGISGLCCNAPYAFASNIGHKLANRSRSFGAVWTQLSDGKVVFSLRSNGDECDVSKLAGLMGGGGHKNAAGFSFTSPEYSEEKGITLWSIEEETDGA